MNLNEHFKAHREPGDYGMTPRIYCADGFNMSVQTGRAAYCSPRDGHGPWFDVEVGFPSEREERLMQWAENPEDPTATVYGYVPIEVVEEVIESHGGISTKD